MPNIAWLRMEPANSRCSPSMTFAVEIIYDLTYIHARTTKVAAHIRRSAWCHNTHVANILILYFRTENPKQTHIWRQNTYTQMTLALRTTCLLPMLISAYNARYPILWFRYSIYVFVIVYVDSVCVNCCSNTNNYLLGYYLLNWTWGGVLYIYGYSHILCHRNCAIYC